MSLFVAHVKAQISISGKQVVLLRVVIQTLSSSQHCRTYPHHNGGKSVMAVPQAGFLPVSNGSGTHLSVNILLTRTQLHGQNLTMREPGKHILLYAQKKRRLVEIL